MKRDDIIEQYKFDLKHAQGELTARATRIRELELLLDSSESRNTELMSVPKTKLEDVKRKLEFEKNSVLVLKRECEKNHDLAESLAKQLKSANRTIAKLKSKRKSAKPMLAIEAAVVTVYSVRDESVPVWIL